MTGNVTSQGRRVATDTSYVGSVLGKVPVQFLRNKRHKYRGFGLI